MASPRRKRITKPRGLVARPMPFHHRVRPVGKQVRRHLQHAFIPHEGNDFRPHALRPRALVGYAVGIVLVKVLVTALLFIVYPNPGFFSSATVDRFVELTNTARTDTGLKKLTVNPKLTAAADAKANDLLDRQYFAHTNPQGKKFWQWIKDQNYKFATAGENLALDFSDADIAHQTLMDSSGHRANILSPKYTQVGFAVKSGEFQGRKTTVLVEMFAKPVNVVTRPVAVAAAQETPSQGSSQPPAGSRTPASDTQPAPTPVPPFRATHPGQNFEQVTVTTGDNAVLSIEFKNEGTVPWQREGPNAVALDTTAPLDRASRLAATSWVSPSRAALLAPAEVAPGSIGRWVFTIHAPEQTGVYAERFVLRLSDGSVIPDSEVTFTVTVEPANVDLQPLPPIASTETTPPSQPATDQAAEPVTSEGITPTGELKKEASVVPPPNLEVSPSLASLVRNSLATSNTLFVLLLVFLSVALLVTVIVRYEVQHRHIIIGALFLIALTAGMLVFGVHFLNLLPTITPKIVSASLTVLPA